MSVTLQYRAKTAEHIIEKFFHCLPHRSIFLGAVTVRRAI